MTSPVDPRSRRNNGRTQPIAISAGIVILAAIVLACAALLAVPLWTALVQDWQVGAMSDPCALKDATARQDCFEKPRPEGSRHPSQSDASGRGDGLRLR